ncbi:alpha/beta-hydrolase [Auriscalpium vulgare]|uniref:Alpha/beta-hydrolase n=1 Tax=Auriscalpium vulgare TaxID=40419 RepID=A0ACB8RRZ2_9AGAM|nr:alpha/beta-hydrolase [Auriscalpium vulgare]
MSFCADCFKGVRHEGTPEGKWETIAGVETYVGTPEVDYPKDKVVLFLSDGFGITLLNNQLLVDDFARNGFKVYAPDFFNGDPAPENLFTPEAPPFDYMEWLGKNSFDVTGERVRGVIDHLKSQGITKFAGTGYCYGARLVFNFSFDNTLAVSAVSHPSSLQPEDVDKYAELAKAPLLINAAEFDEQWPTEKRDKANSVLGGGKFAPGYKEVFFAGTQHGFAVRGDLSDAKVKAGKEGSFEETAKWFFTYL